MAKSRAGGGGRKPLPTALKVLRDNPGRRPLNENEPQPEVRLPIAPAHLSDAARREWRRAGKLLVQQGLMTDLDRAALTAYCVAYARWMECEKQIRENGVLMVEKGVPVVSPYLIVANKAMEQMRVMMLEFGMSPSSRSRVGSGQQEPEEETAFERRYRSRHI